MLVYAVRSGAFVLFEYVAELLVSCRDVVLLM